MVTDANQPPASGSILTTARSVHEMPLSAALRSYPVHLHARATYFDPGNHLLFVQDSTDAVFIELSEKEKVRPRAGDELDIVGVTTADFAPDVAKARIRILGHPGLPAPRTGRFGSASWGREDCHWIELEGSRAARVARSRADTLLTLAWGRNSYKAHVLASAESLAHLVDADVKLAGVCGAFFNSKHQMLGIQMFVPGAECIRVERAPSQDPFSMPPAAIADLLQFSPCEDMGHRRAADSGNRVSLFANRSGSTWVRDATGGVVVQDHDAAGLADR